MLFSMSFGEQRTMDGSFRLLNNKSPWDEDVESISAKRFFVWCKLIPRKRHTDIQHIMALKKTQQDGRDPTP